jgi:hypothetical protein
MPFASPYLFDTLLLLQSLIFMKMSFEIAKEQLGIGY